MAKTSTIVALKYMCQQPLRYVVHISAGYFKKL